MKLSIILVILLLVACNSNEYDIKEANNKLYRLNKSNGEVFVLNDNELVKMNENSNDNFNNEELPKVWPKDTLKYNQSHWPDRYRPYVLPSKDYLKINFVTIWREGNILYKISIKPYNEILVNAIESRFPSFIIHFYDSFDFNLVDFEIPLYELTRTVNDEGITLQLNGKGKISCSKLLYDKINNFSVGWNF